MNVLVTGANGQLGLSIKAQSQHFQEQKIIYTDVEELDITARDQLHDFFKLNKPDYVINCAAYTAVDKAEEEMALARSLNIEAPRLLAECAREFGFTLIHISTDYVFNGQKSTPYTEKDNPDPLSAYGFTKYEGEKAVQNSCETGIVIRTSWLYSEYGNNFVKTIHKLAGEHDQLSIIDDQVGTPTYAGDLAKAILTLIQQECREQEIFHFSNEGVASWYDFSHEIIELSKLPCKVIPISTHEYPLPAIRPNFSLMSKRKFTSRFKYRIPHWTESLKVCLQNLKEMD